MQKKKSALLQKVLRMLKAPIPIARMRKLMIPRIISLNKSRKMKKFMLLRHDNYGFIQEYEFSPSHSPLIHYYRKQAKKRSYGDLYSMFFIGKCFGTVKEKRESRKFPLELTALPSVENTLEIRAFSEASDLSGEDDDSIDEKAEKFIERFYQEIRLQRQQSLIQYTALMLEVN